MGSIVEHQRTEQNTAHGSTCSSSGYIPALPSVAKWAVSALHTNEEEANSPLIRIKGGSCHHCHCCRWDDGAGYLCAFERSICRMHGPDDESMLRKLSWLTLRPRPAPPRSPARCCSRCLHRQPGRWHGPYRGTCQRLQYI